MIDPREAFVPRLGATVQPLYPNARLPRHIVIAVESDAALKRIVAQDWRGTVRYFHPDQVEEVQP